MIESSFQLSVFPVFPNLYNLRYFYVCVLILLIMLSNCALNWAWKQCHNADFYSCAQYSPILFYLYNAKRLRRAVSSSRIAQKQSRTSCRYWGLQKKNKKGPWKSLLLQLYISFYRYRASTLEYITSCVLWKTEVNSVAFLKMREKIKMLESRWMWILIYNCTISRKHRPRAVVVFSSEPRAASKRKIMLINGEKKGRDLFFPRASALVPRGFAARPSCVLSIHCDSKDK